MPSDDLFFASITELNQKLKDREISARELTRAFCDRLESIGPRYNALALSLRERAIRQARAIDGDLKRERFRGPLQGIPFGAKDLLSVAKLPTTWGARPYAAQVFDQDAVVLKKLSNVGAILTGKLAMVELAGGGGYRLPSASLTGAGLNPWDRSRWSGGSSSGSGIAVAAGLVTYALGSETSGSILTPSAFCGVTGLRPTYGLVSREGAMALSWTLDKIGPIARSAEDCGIVLEAISKGFYYTPAYPRQLENLTVGFVAEDSAAADHVKDLGVKLREIKLPDFPYGAVLGAILAAESASIFETLVESGKVKELADLKQAAGLTAAQSVTANDYLKAMRIRTLIQQAFAQLFTGVDVLIAPTRQGIAPKVTEPLDGPSTGRRPSPLIPAGNLAGLPALSLPCGFVDKLPIAIQLVGRPLSETTLIALGRAFQQRTDWHRKRPPV